MIYICLVCGNRAGGIVSKEFPSPNWPQIDLCPDCSKDDYAKAQKKEDEELQKMLANIKKL